MQSFGKGSRSLLKGNSKGVKRIRKKKYAGCECPLHCKERDLSKLLEKVRLTVGGANTIFVN